MESIDVNCLFGNTAYGSAVERISLQFLKALERNFHILVKQPFEKLKLVLQMYHSKIY